MINYLWRNDNIANTFCFQWVSNLNRQITIWFSRLSIGTGILWYCLVVKTTEGYYISSYHLFWLSSTIPNNTCQQNRFQDSRRSSKFLKFCIFHTSTFESRKKTQDDILGGTLSLKKKICWSHTEIGDETVLECLLYRWNADHSKVPLSNIIVRKYKKLRPYYQIPHPYACHYVIKFVRYLRQVGSFLRFHSPIKLTA